MTNTKTFNFFTLTCIFLFYVHIVSTLDCFDCGYCRDLATCTCNTSKTVDASKLYCILLRENFESGSAFEIRYISKDNTPYISVPYYISVTETILYNTTTRHWDHVSNKIIYGCQTDKCNQADLLKQFPKNGLSLMLPLDWLDNNLLRQSVTESTKCRDCSSDDECKTVSNSVSLNQCSPISCLDSCMIGEKLPKAGASQYCYEYVCTDDTSYEPKLLTPQVIITAVYYISSKNFDTVEINAVCNGLDCSQVKIFSDIKSKLQKDFSGIKPFLPDNHGNTIYTTTSIVMMLIVLQKCTFY